MAGRLCRVLRRSLEEDAGRRDVLVDWGQSFLQTAGSCRGAVAVGDGDVPSGYVRIANWKLTVNGHFQ